MGSNGLEPPTILNYDVGCKSHKTKQWPRLGGFWQASIAVFLTGSLEHHKLQPIGSMGLV